MTAYDFLNKMKDLEIHYFIKEEIIMNEKDFDFLGCKYIYSDKNIEELNKLSKAIDNLHLVKLDNLSVVNEELKKRKDDLIKDKLRFSP